ncbi:MAG: hypothetical protein JWM47_452 [Acidimicrobiales bacterium]|nr:hypothetical protein [Acidimicrobiales bacterium]
MADMVNGRRPNGPAQAPIWRGPLWQLLRDGRWAGWLVVITVVLRLLAVAGLRLQVYVDSLEYGTVDFSGRNRRPWATPLMHWLVPGGDQHLVVAQAVVGAACWAALALSAAAWFHWPWTRRLVAGTVVALGCTPAVTNWDTTKLSEPLALSLTALVIAAWLNLLRRPDTRTAILVLLATLPWLFVRHGVMPAAWMAVAAAVAGAAVSWWRGGPAKVFGAVALAMVALVGVASASYGRNPSIVQQNLTGIVATRVVPDRDRLAWFTEHGMPLPASGRLDYPTLRDDAVFGEWAAGEGPATYVKYLATHPTYTATGPVSDMASVQRSPSDERDAETTTLSPAHFYGSARNVVPDQVEDLLFAPGRTGTVVSAVAISVAWMVAGRRRRHRGWVVPSAVIAISLASFFASWNGSVPEQPRHAMVSAVGLRIGLILQLAMLAEGELLARRGAGAGPGEPVPGVAQGTRRGASATS